MGQAHVANLLSKGFPVAVWNRSVDKCQAPQSAGAKVVAIPADVVKASDVTFVMLSNARVARDVYQQPNGVLEGLANSSNCNGIVDCASLDATAASDLVLSTIRL